MPKLLLFPPNPKSILDRGIAHFEGAPDSVIHAAIAFDTYYVEAVVPLVRMMPIESLSDNVQITPIKCTPEQAQALEAYLRKRVGTVHYAVQQLGVDAIGYITGHWLPSAKGGVVCSGIAAEALVAANITTTSPYDPGDVSPEWLEWWVQAGQPHDMGALIAERCKK